MATKRKTRVDVPIPNIGTDNPTIMPSTSSAPAYSPFVPTLSESLIFATYPLILVLGSLYATFHPALRNSNYLPDAQSYDPSFAPSYFAKKSNVFNVYFVKIGWLWMTAAFFLHIFTHPSHGPAYQFQLTRRRVQAAIRYLCITTTWFAVTQWFFGPAIIDRSFRWTGGQCEMIFSDAPEDQLRKEEMGDVREIFTHAACKTIGGTWRGGHDISGHVFLLILGSAMLLLETWPAVLKSAGLKETRWIRTADGSTKDAVVEADQPTSGAQGSLKGLGIKIALAVAGLCCWMLLMTATYFHTWFEKLTGLLVAFSAVYLIYFLPRGAPGLRRLIGLPGV